MPPSQLILMSDSANNMNKNDIVEQRFSPSTVFDESATAMNPQKASHSVTEKIKTFQRLWDSGSSGHDYSVIDEDNNIQNFREDDINVTKLLGRGAFADVHQAYVKQNIDEIYAIKRLRPSILSNSDDFQISTADLALETSILSSLRHTNIIKLHGIKEGNTFQLLRSGSFFLALEVLVETLQTRLRRWQKHWTKQMLRSSLDSNTVIQRLENIAMGVVSAMEYLHTSRIIYRDLKPLNIGFDDLNDEVKIFDFGFARLCNKEDEERLMTGGMGTPRYMAPEVATHSPNYSFPVDVYSFSIMLWQIVTNRTPFKEIKTASTLAAKVVVGNKRPSLRYIQSEALKELIKSGWAADPADRPTFSEIKHKLKSIIREHHSVPSTGALSPEDCNGSKRNISIRRRPSLSSSNEKNEKRLSKTRSWRNIGMYRKKERQTSSSSISISSVDDDSTSEPVKVPMKARRRVSAPTSMGQDIAQAMFEMGMSNEVFHSQEGPKTKLHNRFEEILNSNPTTTAEETVDYQMPLKDDESFTVPSFVDGEKSGDDFRNLNFNDSKSSVYSYDTISFEDNEAGNETRGVTNPFFQRTNFRTKRRNSLGF